MYQGVHVLANQNTQDCWEKWQGYRDAFGNIIQTTINRYNVIPNHILILGAGNGNDIPIDLIESIFEEIVLVDIDNNALNNFLNKTSDKSKYQTHIIDLSGIADQVESVDLINVSNSALANIISNLKPNINLSAIKGKFNIILNANYFSQLTAPLSYKFLKDHKQAPNYIKKALSKVNNEIQAYLFQEINNLLEVNGICIHSTDIIEIYYNELTKEKNESCVLVMKATNGLQDMANIQSILHIIDERGLRIEGSNYPVNLIQELFDTKTSFFMYWPFDHGEFIIKGYVVQVLILQKK
ncbi:hypothetical protein FOI68_21630 [Brevibacillus sp. LEMMJ03]|uniref:class I SAM-dependent methyltransferase n=1 Tax=Brevibacillus sp. LEMMJ03 TaxID=2595056 RepID=UPI0011810F05|nr:class I SAM-dependent methyltransferase [Brevibacillus sp. LEMMJ03]TRY23301.1 hypothetical protein FOI68_21630 [Brevibacillus sp. LEMMJ03]